MFSILNKDLADIGFFINLDTSKDRLDHINKLIKKYNIKNLERFGALKDPLNVYSCTKSHLEVFKISKDRNLQTIFVGEDDMDIKDECYYPNSNLEFTKSLDLVIEDLKTIEWDVILFGCNPKENLNRVTDNLYSVTKSTGSWAYMIKSSAYNYILENSNYKRDYIAIDDWLGLLSSKGFKVFTTIPMLIKHAVGFESTLQPNGPVNYDVWINGNYHNFVYEQFRFKKLLEE
jgi:GR25 family glycosyltransferase involved in LPS biosynthesis